MANMKKITEVSLANEVLENDTVLGERDGAAVRLPAGALCGSGGGGAEEPISIEIEIWDTASGPTINSYNASISFDEAYALSELELNRRMVRRQEGVEDVKLFHVRKFNTRNDGNMIMFEVFNGVPLSDKTYTVDTIYCVWKPEEMYVLQVTD